MCTKKGPGSGTFRSTLGLTYRLPPKHFGLGLSWNMSCRSWASHWWKGAEVLQPPPFTGFHVFFSFFSQLWWLMIFDLHASNIMNSILKTSLATKNQWYLFLVASKVLFVPRQRDWCFFCVYLKIFDHQKSTSMQRFPWLTWSLKLRAIFDSRMTWRNLGLTTCFWRADHRIPEICSFRVYMEGNLAWCQAKGAWRSIEL